MNINNQVTLIGNVSIAPLFRIGDTPDKHNLFYSLAVPRNYVSQDGKTETDFIPINVFGNAALAMSKHIDKGTKIAVTGSIQMTKSRGDNQPTKMYFYQSSFSVLRYTEKQKQARNAVMNEQEFPVFTPTPEEVPPFPTIDPYDLM